MDIKNYHTLLGSILVWVIIVLVYEGSSFRSLKFTRQHFKPLETQREFVDGMLGTRYKTGTVWPKPQKMISNSMEFVLSPQYFNVQYTNTSFKCADVDSAIDRYMKIIFGNITERSESTSENNALDQLFIHVSKSCEKYPHFRASESYQLEVKGTSMLIAKTQWGIMRGLETFAQLIHLNDRKELVINDGSVTDFPRFPYRGLMIDTARHFIPVELILKNLEIMSYNKLNVFHWHISDHQSFPLALSGLPELAKNGAYDNKNAIYTEKDVEQIVEFARERGIRVIPEIDLPAHAHAISKSRPDLFVGCTITRNNKKEYMGTLDPTNPEIFVFVGELYAEIKRLFPDEYLHIGVDEVPHDCWSSNAKIHGFMKKNRIGYADLDKLLMEGLLQEARKLNMSTISWHDVFKTGYTQTPTVIEVWEMMQPRSVVRSLTSNAFDVIIAYAWYLDITLKKKWDMLYNTEPSMYAGKLDQHHVLGGESCMWTEHIDGSNIMTEIWPGASAAAEKLWSNRKVTDLQDAMTRMSNFRCVLKCRNIETSPLSPGYCHID